MFFIDSYLLVILLVVKVSKYLQIINLVLCIMLRILDVYGGKYERNINDVWGF